MDDGGDRGGVLMASRWRFLGRGSWLQFRKKSASISPPNIMHFSRDRAMIGPRLGHNRATIGPRSWSWSFFDRRPLDWLRFHHVNSPIAAQSRRDRGSIGPRSWSSSTKPLSHPMKRQENGRSDRDQAASIFDDDPTLLASPRGVM